jgi:NAD(P)-dependent dehydrogenase (short-subunit alcohol dehydrogenase family)
MHLRNKTVVITGASKGLGLGLVEALVSHGASVTVVARGSEALDSVRDCSGVSTVAADVTDAAVTHEVLAATRPDLLVLNAGARPPMGRLDRLTWDEFSATWDTVVQAGFHWMQAALTLPLARASRVLVGSSGAALNGSALSGGYAGAKRMLWVMARYANGVG